MPPFCCWGVRWLPCRPHGLCLQKACKATSPSWEQPNLPVLPILGRLLLQFLQLSVSQSMVVLNPSAATTRLCMTTFNPSRMQRLSLSRRQIWLRKYQMPHSTSATKLICSTRSYTPMSILWMSADRLSPICKSSCQNITPLSPRKANSTMTTK